MAVKKLIEVALPLDAINKASAYEKMPGIGPHPRGLHLWWARRPLSTARAVIWASLVDDPSSHPDKFPTEEDQAAERERLFKILDQLVQYKNSNDERVIGEAKAEIRKSMGDEPIKLLDPFAGGGAIPLEAQRLGLEAYAQDLNPIPVTINKAMIEIPPKFAGHAAMNPDAQARKHMEDWSGNAGLAADVEYYGTWMRDEAYRRIGNLYPKVRVPAEQGGGEATVITWIWARTVRCSNPACGHTSPLVRSFDLSKKKGKEWHVEPSCHDGEVSFAVAPGKSKRGGTVNRRGATCLHCGAPINFDYIRDESCEGRMGAQLMAVVAEGQHGRIYVSPSAEQVEAADVPLPEDYPDGKLAYYPGHLNTVIYGLDEFWKLFTKRQLTALTTFSGLVHEAQERATQDAIAAGTADDGVGLSDHGGGAKAYGEAVGVYLAFAIDRLADFSNAVTRWAPTNEKSMNMFSKQAIAMTWDYPEVNVFSESVGSFYAILDYIISCMKTLPIHIELPGHSKQFDAQSDNDMQDIMVSTDPPYYDNIGYADLSDFFYVWLRQSLRKTYPKLFSTMLVPKEEELVATPYRDNRGKEGARDFFEEGMYHAIKRIHANARDDIPVTIYYAFKQSETETSNDVEATASTGWETMLSAIIRAGFAITGTWPVRTEQAYRSISQGSNALASSIVLVCRKRPADAPMATRREFVNALKRELRPALDKLRTSNIAPVDMAQSAIGPGIGVYSRYSKVLESDGSEMTVRSALQVINQELDLYFSDQDSDLDRDSRFCVDLYTQCAFNEIRFGEADVLARAKNTSIEGLAAKGALSSSKGVVRLLGRDEIKDRGDWSFTWLFCQRLTRAMETGGVEECARLLKDVYDSRAENARALAYRLFTIADKKGWNGEAFAYNSLVVAWPEIQTRAAQLQAATPKQYTLEDLAGMEGDE